MFFIYSHKNYNIYLILFTIILSINPQMISPKQNPYPVSSSTPQNPLSVNSLPQNCLVFNFYNKCSSCQYGYYLLKKKNSCLQDCPIGYQKDQLNKICDRIQTIYQYDYTLNSKRQDITQLQISIFYGLKTSRKVSQIIIVILTILLSLILILGLICVLFYNFNHARQQEIKPIYYRKYFVVENFDFVQVNHNDQIIRMNFI